MRGKAKRICARSTKADLDTLADDAEALHKLDQAKLAKGSKDGFESRLGWWKKRCRVRRVCCLPFTVPKLELAAALLRKGGYRSGHLYLSAIKKAHVVAGFDWSAQHAQALADANRALKRGLGPAKQAQPLPTASLASAEGVEKLAAAAKQRWPAAGVYAAIVSTAWLLREIESSTAAFWSVTVHSKVDESMGDCGWAEWYLPISKTDVMALGKKRALACACPSPCCPVKAMRHVKHASLRVARDLGHDEPPPDWPLLVKANGKPLSKEQTVRFYRDMVFAVGLSQEGITGHSARVAGAQRMAEAGIEVTTIQLFGRWGSDAVLRYVREAALGMHGGNLARMTERPGVDIEDRIMAKLAAAWPKQSEGIIAAIRDKEIEEIAERVLPLLLKSGAAKHEATDWSGLVDSIKAEYQGGFDVLTGSTIAEFVQCEGGRAHVTLDYCYTLCGWDWCHGKGQAILPHQWDTMSGTRKCKTCVGRSESPVIVH